MRGWHVLGFALAGGVAVLAAGAAEADECLRKVDDMLVVYALPPSPEFAAAYLNTAGDNRIPGGRLHQPAPAPPPSTLGEEPATPRSHMQPRGTAEERLPSGLAVSAAVPRLSADTRQRLQETLYKARAAEAAGKEAECEALLSSAESLVPPAKNAARPRIQ
jgi:hypothetical protein